MVSNRFKPKRLKSKVFRITRRKQGPAGISLRKITRILDRRCRHRVYSKMVKPILDRGVRRGVVTEVDGRYKMVERTAFKGHDGRKHPQEDIEPMSAPEATSVANIGNENAIEISYGEENVESQVLNDVIRLYSELSLKNKCSNGEEYVESQALNDVIRLYSELSLKTK